MKTYIEEERLKSIRKIVGKRSANVQSEIGKPYTLVRCGKQKQVSVCHTMVEGVHFNLLQMNAWELGFKALSIAVNRSLACGAVPTHASISMGIRQDSSVPFIREFYRGIIELAGKYKIDIIGCETVDSPNFLFTSLNVLSPAPRRLLDMGGAKQGDVIALTGRLGLAGAGMQCLKQLGRPKLYNHQGVLTAYLTPEPRFEEAKILSRSSGVNAIVLVEGGLSSEIHTLCEDSNKGALLAEEKILVDESLLKAAKLVDANPVRLVYYGPEDFHFLVAVKRAAFNRLQSSFKKKKLELYEIGMIKNRSFEVKLDRVDGRRVVLEPREYHPIVRQQTA